MKPRSAPIADLARGLFQCVKYTAVTEAVARTRLEEVDCRAILALGGALPADLEGIRSILEIEVRVELSRRLV